MFARGQMPFAYKLPSGSIMVNELLPDVPAHQEKTVVYCRVSTAKQKDDLQQQVELVTAFCAARGWAIDKVYKEIASGLNDNRPQLNKLLSDQSITRVVVADKDRLTRFGFNFINQWLVSRRCALEVINKAESDRDDLMADFVSVITSMAARVYGVRRRKEQIEQIITSISK